MRKSNPLVQLFVAIYFIYGEYEKLFYYPKMVTHFVQIFYQSETKMSSAYIATLETHLNGI